MVSYSNEILNLFGAPELSELTICGAKELPPLPNYLSNALWNHITGTRHPDTAIRHLDLALLRRTNAACEEYRAGHNNLIRYVGGLKSGKHNLEVYLSALTHFEQCLNAFWCGAEIFNKIEKRVLRDTRRELTLYDKREDSDLKRINLLNDIAKHFNADQAEKTTTPIWITNHGLKSADIELTFDELYENLMSLSEIARQTFVEIPKEAVARRQGQK